MCQICAALRPFDSNCGYDSLAAAAPDSVSGPVAASQSAQASPATIATYLASGYWTALQQSPRALQLGEGNSVTVDLSGLDGARQAVARSALEAWTASTGITFADYVAPVPTVVQESADLAGNAASTGRLAPGERVQGSLGGSDTSDWTRLDVSNGQTYTLTLRGDGLADPVLYLRDANGNQLLSAGPNSATTFTATGDGYFFVDVQSAGGGSGGYTLDAVLGAGQGGAQISFRSDLSGSTTNATVSGNTLLSAEVNVATSWDNGNLSYDSYTFMTYIHEIGHALGLGHPGLYNSGAVYGRDELFANDSWRMSVMSYFNQTENTSIDATHAVAVTPMLADILAIQQIYGDLPDLRTGNTVYGAGTNVTGYLGDLFRFWSGETARDPARYQGNPFAFVLVDDGGIDTVDLSFAPAAQRIDLRAGSFSDVGGYAGNMGIAAGTVIENAVGGARNDTLIGNSADNRLTGGAGNDLLQGGEGTGDRAVFGLERAAATIRVEGDRVIVTSSLGTDTLTGIEYLVFNDQTVAAAAAASGGSTTPTSGNDTLTGTEGADLLAGLAGNDSVLGLGGDDTLYGGPGVDTLDGGAGNDLLGGTTENDLLLGGAGDDQAYGAAGDDTIRGGAGNDTLGGSIGNDQLHGEDGADGLWGAGGDDVIFGGTGNDTLGGSVGNDTLAGEDGNDELWGAAGNDLLSGGAGDDMLGASIGDDTLFGDAGQDELWGADGHDFLNGGADNDRLGGGTGNDRLEGGEGNDQMFGGLGNDVMIGGAGQDTLYGADGDDTIDGGLGNDEIYAGADADIIVFSEGADRAHFFSVAQDLIDMTRADMLGEITDYADLTANHLTEMAGNTIITDDQGHSLTLMNVSIADLGEDNFHFL